MNGSVDLDPLSMFAAEEEQQKTTTTPARKGITGMLSDIFSEASALASSTKPSNGIMPVAGIPAPFVTAAQSQRATEATQSITGTPIVAPARKSIFQDEPPGASARLSLAANVSALNRPAQVLTGMHGWESAAPPAPASIAVPPSPTRAEEANIAAAHMQAAGSLEDAVATELLTGEQRLMSLRDAFIEISKGRFMPGILYMTNYRTMFVPNAANMATIASQNPSLYSWLSIPLACIEKIEKDKRVTRDSTGKGVGIVIHCKDMREHRITIQGKSGTDYEVDRAIGVLSAYAYPNQLRFMFAFSHVLTRSDGTAVEPLQPYDMVKEYTRQGIIDYNTKGLDSSTATANRRNGEFLWRISSANMGFKLCSTYSQLLAMPSGISDEELFRVAAFRSGQRLPAMSWGSSKNGATLWRSSQPKAGVMAACVQDEKLLNVISNSCTHNRRNPCLHIVDCRPRASAMANKAAGAGYESTSNYPYIRLEFYNIGNIHVMRDSIKSVASLMLNASSSSGTCR